MFESKLKSEKCFSCCSESQCILNWELHLLDTAFVLPSDLECRHIQPHIYVKSYRILDRHASIVIVRRNKSQDEWSIFPCNLSNIFHNCGGDMTAIEWTGWQHCVCNQEIRERCSTSQDKTLLWPIFSCLFPPQGLPLQRWLCG